MLITKILPGLINVVTLLCTRNNKCSIVYDRLVFAVISACSNEPRHDIYINVVCATSKDSDQPEHTRSLISAFASRMNIL